jgi:hypothetical protein
MKMILRSNFLQGGLMLLTEHRESSSLERIQKVQPERMKKLEKAVAKASIFITCCIMRDGLL